MTTSFKLLLILATALACVGLGYLLHGTPPPAPSVRAATAVVHETDTLYRRDTLRAVRWATRYDTARVTDTLTHDSIVYVKRDVADSVVHACRDILSSCALALRARDGKIAALEAARPSRLHTLITGGLLLGGGYVLGRSGVGARMIGLRLPF